MIASLSPSCNDRLSWKWIKMQQNMDFSDSYLDHLFSRVGSATAGARAPFGQVLELFFNFLF